MLEQGQRRLSQVPFPIYHDHVVAGTPEVLARPSLFACRASADFVHKIGTRLPLFMIFTKLLVRSLSLQPGLLRSTLTGYIVESLSGQPLPAAHRLLATWLSEFCHDRDLDNERPRCPHPTRLSTVYLGTLFYDHHLPTSLRHQETRLPIHRRMQRVGLRPE
jgi:hypothetical protein